MSIYDVLNPKNFAGAALAAGLSLHPATSHAQQQNPSGTSSDAASGTLQVKNADGSILGCSTNMPGDGFTVDANGKILNWTQNLNRQGGSDGTVVMRQGTLVQGPDHKMHPVLEDVGEGVKLDGRVMDMKAQGRVMVEVADMTNTQLGQFMKAKLPTLRKACQRLLSTVQR